MDPITGALVVKGIYDLALKPIQEELMEALKETAKEKALKTVTAYRVNNFMAQLAIELSGPNPDANSNIDEWINKITSSEPRLEVLADAHKKVALSISRTLGPRIAAMIVAPLLMSGEMANEEQEIMLHAAATVSDADLIWFKTRFLAATPASEGYVILHHEHRKLPLPLSVVRLVACGLVFTGSPYTTPEILEAAGSMDGVHGSAADDTFVYALDSMRKFADLVARAQGPAT